MNDEELQRAREAGLNLLARREHSRQELRAKLATRGYDTDTVENTLAGLVEEGLLSEVRFAESYVASRSRRGVGPLRLRAELRQRGLDDAAIDDALADPGLDWIAQARQAKQKKFGDAAPADLRERARQTRFLEYRGFDAEQIRAVLGRQ
ncbi:MAG: regulatory protein RecX [Gammaproteobacteria bacterium]|nr:regulatory protein RecX [Gammaproteobacteria bacterium]NNM21123.1 regulatory protein RecX [Gammaproteobacteria bacterium]